MLIIYRCLINFLNIIAPLIIFFRIKKKKEHPKRYKEKFGVMSNTRKAGKLIWFHGSSVGEILSIIPLIHKFEKNKKINQILVTSSTLSSSKVFKKYKFKKTIHQFFPIDTKVIVKKFLNYWRPNTVFFIESEIWPNFINEIKNAGIKLILLNGRITKKSYNRWIKLKNFSNYLFKKFDLCLSQNQETSNYLKLLGAKNIKNYGNLKFSEHIEKQNIIKNKYLDNFFKKKKKIFCGVSTHMSEEEFCAKIHKELKKKWPKLLTIIIPRHVERCNQIVESLEKYELKIHKHSSKKTINKKVDIYLVDTFGETKFFLKRCPIVFLGGSLIEHGGQNPIEAARFGCKVLHGPNISNFTEVYELLKKYNISSLINQNKEAVLKVKKILSKKSSPNSDLFKLKALGKNVLNKNYKELVKYI